MTFDLEFKRRTREPTDELIDLWRRARVAAEDAPACPCHGIVAGRVDPDAMETNMLAALRTRYRESGQSELVDLIERRLRKSPFAGMRQPFEGWLCGLPAGGLAENTRTVIYTDLASLLRYYAEAQSFVCTQE